MIINNYQIYGTKLNNLHHLKKMLKCNLFHKSAHKNQQFKDLEAKVIKRRANSSVMQFSNKSNSKVCTD